MVTKPTLALIPPARWIVFGILATLYFMVYFQRQAPAVLAVDLMRDIRIKGSSLGLLSASFFYAYAIMQVPAGIISRSLGPRRSLCLFFGLASLATILFGVCDTFVTALLTRIVVGLGLAMVLVPMLDILAEWFRPDEFGRVVGLVLAVGGLGVFAGGGPLAHLDALLGWRESFLAVGVISLALAFIAWFSISVPRTDASGKQDRKAASEVKRDEEDGALETLATILTDLRFWPPALWGFFAVGVFTAFGGLWGGPYLIHVYGLSKVQTGHILSMQAVGMILGSPGLAFVAEKLLSSRKKVLVGAGAGLLLLTLLLVLKPSGWSLYGLYGCFFVMSLCSMAALPLALVVTRNEFPSSVSGIVTGVFNFFSILGGATIQFAVGVLLDHYSGGAGSFDTGHYRLMFLLFLASAVVILLAALAIKERA